MLDAMASSLRHAYTTISDKALQFQNQSFADACMAGCALVTMADGVMQSEERSKVVQCIRNVTDLHYFVATDLRDSFDAFCRQATEPFSRIDVIKAIGKVKSDADQADMVVKIGIIIAKANGEFEEVEKKVIREIIHTLGLNESDYDLDSAPVSATTSAPNPPVTPAPAATPPPAATAPATRQPRVQGTSLKDVKPGERVSLKQITGSAPAKLVAGFGWEPDSALLSASALIFDMDKKLLQTVALGSASATAGGVAHNGNTAGTSKVGDDEEISINLAAVPGAANSIVFVIAPSAGQVARAVKSAYVRLSDPDKNSQLIRFDFSVQGEAAALVVARVYLNNGEWKFAAVGDAVRNGTADTIQTQIAAFA